MTTTEIRPKDGQEKYEAIAYRMYLADFQLHFADSETPLTWEELDADEKFAWTYIAAAGLREAAILDDFQLVEVVENYRSRTPYPIADGETWESVTAGFFKWGYDQVFFTYNMPSADATGLN
jgi:hypothetical protein